MPKKIKHNPIHDIDKRAGLTLKQLRWMNAMTQTELAKLVGVKFQQVQKYETGANRISVSRLHMICDALGVTIAEFYDIMKEHETGTDIPTRKHNEPSIADMMLSRRSLKYVSMFLRLEEEKQDAIIGIMKYLTEK